MLAKAAIQRLRSLREKEGREALGLFAVEGEKLVRDLLAEGFAFDEIYATEAWDGRRTHDVSASEMQRLSRLPTPSAVLALAPLRQQPLPAGALDRGYALALDGVQDPGNVGTIWRVADWFGFDRLLLSSDCADPFSPKVVQASMGAFARVPVHRVDLAAALAAAQAPVLGCDLEGESAHRLAPLPAAVVVIGSEGRGLSTEVRRVVARRVTIPRYGRAESLNAALAAAVVCDNLRRLASD